MDRSEFDGDKPRGDTGRCAAEPEQALEPSKESERWLRSVVQNTSDIISISGSDGTIRYVSPSVERVLGYTPEELIGMSGLDHIHPDDVGLAVDVLAEARDNSGLRPSVEVRSRHKDGSWRWLEVTGSSLPDDPDVRGNVSSARDITKRKEAEQQLRDSEERFRSLTQNSSDLISLLEPDGTIRYQSLALERMLGYSQEELIGENAFDYVHPDDLERVFGAFLEGLTNPELRPSAEYRLRHKDGSWRWLESVGSNLLEDPIVGGLVVNSRDITERKTLEERLQHQAFHDSLTDLPNRHLFMDRLEQALKRTRRRRRSKAAVLFMDLNDFKVVNDSLGHEVGDRILVAVAERLKTKASTCGHPQDRQVVHRRVR